MAWKDELKHALGLEAAPSAEEGEQVEVVVRGNVINVPRMTVSELFNELGLESDKYIALDLDRAAPLCGEDTLATRTGIVPVRVDG